MLPLWMAPRKVLPNEKADMVRYPSGVGDHPAAMNLRFQTEASFVRRVGGAEVVGGKSVGVGKLGPNPLLSVRENV